MWAGPRWEGEGGLKPSAGAQPRPGFLINARQNCALHLPRLSAHKAMGLGVFSIAEAVGGEGLEAF
jgi:hypothetical protein